jgi:hypothetical protein
VTRSSWIQLSVPRGQRADDGLQVRGGAGGTAADLDDLRRVSGVLHSVAVRLADHGQQVLAIARDPRPTITAFAAVMPPMAVASFASALADAAVGPDGLAAISARTTALATDISRVADAYQSVDLVAALGLEDRLRAEAIRGFSTLAGLAGANIRVGTDGPPWLTDTIATRSKVSPVRCEGPPVNLFAVLSRIPGSNHGRPMVHVEHVDGPLGRRWLVYIPGTAAWSPTPGETPFDLSADVRLISHHRSAAMVGIAEALRSLGARVGEPVLLAGHSQGGLIAAGLASDPRFRRQFTVTHVLTAGAPIGSMSIPAQVQVLSIEHRDDPVPRLEGQQNPDRTNWTTVSAWSAHGGSPHTLGHYEQTAVKVDASNNDSVQAWKRSAAGFFDMPRHSSQVPAASSCTAWDVELSRVGSE